VSHAGIWWHNWAQVSHWETSRPRETRVAWASFPDSTEESWFWKTCWLTFCVTQHGTSLWSRLLLGQQVIPEQGSRVTESQNGRGWKGPLWVI